MIILHSSYNIGTVSGFCKQPTEPHECDWIDFTISGAIPVSPDKKDG